MILIKPLNDQVLIKVDSEETKSPGGLFLVPSQDPVSKTSGVVVAIGDNAVIKIKPGDHVIFEKGMGRRFSIPVTRASENGVKWTEKEEHILISYYDVLAEMAD